MTAPVDTDRVRAVVSACAGVARVHGRGPNGVAADAAEVEVHVVARYGVVLPELAERIDRELAPLLGGRTLKLVVDDLVSDDEDDRDEPDDPAGDDAPTLSPGAGASAPALTARAEVPALPPGAGSGVDA